MDNVCINSVCNKSSGWKEISVKVHFNNNVFEKQNLNQWIRDFKNQNSRCWCGCHGDLDQNLSSSSSSPTERLQTVIPSRCFWDIVKKKGTETPKKHNSSTSMRLNLDIFPSNWKCISQSLLVQSGRSFTNSLLHPNSRSYESFITCHPPPPTHTHTHTHTHQARDPVSGGSPEGIRLTPLLVTSAKYDGLIFT